MSPRNLNGCNYYQMSEDLYNQWLDRETWCHVEKARRLAQRRHYTFGNESRGDILDVPYYGKDAPFTHRDRNRPVYFPGVRRQFPEQKNRSYLSRYMP